MATYTLEADTRTKKAGDKKGMINVDGIFGQSTQLWA